jgi:hypothetical protein
MANSMLHENLATRKTNATLWSTFNTRKKKLPMLEEKNN